MERRNPLVSKNIKKESIRFFVSWITDLTEEIKLCSTWSLRNKINEWKNILIVHLIVLFLKTQANDMHFEFGLKSCGMIHAHDVM